MEMEEMEHQETEDAIKEESKQVSGIRKCEFSAFSTFLNRTDNASWGYRRFTHGC